jgi:hypothetical protein
MLNINEVTEQTTATIDILHPVTREPLGAQVTLAGPEHPDRKRLQFARQRKARAAYAKRGKLEFDDPEDEQLDEIDYLATCTLGWTGIGENNKLIEHSKTAAQALYAKPEMRWLRIQLLAALNELENFIAPSGSN